MDSLRGFLPDQDDSLNDVFGLDGHDDEIGDDLPPTAVGQDERRMQVRAYNFWAAMLGDRTYPSSDELDPAAQTDFGPFSVLLDFTAGIENPAIAYLGDKLAEECGTSGPIQRLSDVPSRSLLSRITDHYLQIIANQAPIGFEAEFVNQRGTTVLYRGILLPYSSDDQSIDFIYGVINWKELADQKMADELLLEIDQALEPLTFQDSDVLPMTYWADGPSKSRDTLDLADAGMEVPEDLPRPDLSAMDAASPSPAPLSLPFAQDSEGMELADWLASARDLADEARSCDSRTRQALYAAISRAYDFSLAARKQPEDFRQIAEDAGLTIQSRAPMVPVAKLVFGIDYDKTRLAEFAAALDHAHRHGLRCGELDALLSNHPGGLKAIVAQEREARREESGKAKKTPPRTGPRESVARKLRKLESHSFAEIPAEGSEFTLLVARRDAEGNVVLLGEVSQDAALIEKAARHLFD